MSDDEYVAHMAELGASGFLLKQSTGSMMADAIREIAQSGHCFSEEITDRFLRAER